MMSRTSLRGLLYLVSLLAVGYFLEETHFGASLNQAWIDSAVRNHGVAGELLFIGVGILATALALPRQIISFLGGYAFGFALGTLLAPLAMLGGCVLSFFYARWLGRDYIAQRFGARVKRIDTFLQRNPFAMSLLIRLLPVGRNLTTNLAAGVSSVRPMPFFLGSLFGFVPQTLVFVLLGSGISVDRELRIGLAVVLFLLSAMLGVWLYRQYRFAQDFGRAVEDLCPAATTTSPKIS